MLLDELHLLAGQADLPARLAQLRPGNIHILPPTAFYTPCWDGRAAKLFYERNDYDLSGALELVARNIPTPPRARSFNCNES